MAEISSPTYIAGLLQNPPSPTSTIYSFLTQGMSDHWGMGFAIFENPEEDDLTGKRRDRRYFKKVKRLMKDGVITDDGNAFLASNWRVSAVGRETVDINGSETTFTATLYENDAGEGVVTTIKPIDGDGKEIPEEKWADLLTTRDEIWEHRARYGEIYENLIKPPAPPTPEPEPVTVEEPPEPPEDTPIIAESKPWWKFW